MIEPVVRLGKIRFVNPEREPILVAEIVNDTEGYTLSA